MRTDEEVNPEGGIKRVGKSGQISLGKQHTGQYFREERREDGAIVLVPVAVVTKSVWKLLDQGKVRKALEWAAQNPAKESDLDELLRAWSARVAARQVKGPATRKRRGR